MKLISYLFSLNCLIAFSSFSPFSFSADKLSLNGVFGSHMVMQRNTPITFSGKAPANSEIALVLIQQTTGSAPNTNANQQLYTTNTNKEGNWSLKINPHQAGGPFLVTIDASSSNSNQQADQFSTIKLEDVYFGDVWLASGQSNMEWKLKGDVDNWREEVADSDYPMIRYFEVPNRYAATEQTSIEPTTWQVASSTTTPRFSAVAWFFAKHALQHTNVPIGIIDSTWGGTPAEAWTPLPVLLNEPGYQQQAKAFLDEPERWQSIFDDTRKDEEAQSQVLNSVDNKIVNELSSLNVDDSQWQTSSLPLKEASSDILWAKRDFLLSEAQLKKLNNATKSSPTDQNNALALRIGNYSRHTNVFVNSEPVEQAEGALSREPLIVPISLLKAGRNVILIRTANGWSNRVNIGSSNKLQLFDNSDPNLIIDLQHNWKVNNTLEGKLPMPKKYWQSSGTLYNAMIKPIEHYPLKGVIWYQGESNTNRANEYQSLFMSMIQSWRGAWQQPTLPFIFAQLASMNAQQNEPMQSNWATLREAQRLSLALPNTAMAVLIDAGEADDIHPKNKQIVGKRLWLGAKAIAYNQDVVYSGPLGTGFSVNGQNLTLNFEHSYNGLIKKGGLMKKGDKIIGFELAGADNIFFNADAEISKQNGADVVVVHAQQVANPLSIRYAWADNSPANLYNTEGLPAVPFQLGKIAEPITPKLTKVLIVDGQNNHDVWPQTTSMMKQQLENTGQFSVDIYRTQFTFKGADLLINFGLQDGKTYSDGEPKTDPSFNPNFNQYDVVISNFGWRTAPWPQSTKAAFEQYVHSGGGFVSVHAANNAFPNWPAYNEMIGLGGWGDRDQSNGPYVYFDEGCQQTSDNSQGKAGGHAPAHEFEITNCAPHHPIMQGLPRSWMHTKDELYNKLRGPALNMTTVATAYDNPENGGTGRYEPVVMAIEYGQGRVFHTTLGHSPSVFDSVEFQTLLRNGVRWAAGR